MQTRCIDHRLQAHLRLQLYAGYWIPRHNQFFGRALRGGGWYPDHQLRLLRRDRARYDEARLVHELVRLDGEAGYLHGHLLHLNIEQLGELWRKQTSYALQEAQTLYLAGSARAGATSRARRCASFSAATSSSAATAMARLGCSCARRWPTSSW